MSNSTYETVPRTYSFFVAWHTREVWEKNNQSRYSGCTFLPSPTVMSDQGTAESGAARPKYTSPGYNSWCNVSATTRPTCKAHAAELTCCTARELPSLCIAWQERAASSTAWCKTPRNQGPTKRRKTQGSQDFVYKCLQFTVLSRFT